MNSTVTHTVVCSLTQSPVYTWTPTVTPSPVYTPSPTLIESSTLSSISQSPSSMQMQSLSPTFTPYPSISATPICRLAPMPAISSTILSSISDNTFYAVVCALTIIFLLNLSCSIHYYNEYTNEKTRKRVFDQVYQNPSHSSVRDSLNRV